METKKDEARRLPIKKEMIEINKNLLRVVLYLVAGACLAVLIIL